MREGSRVRLGDDEVKRRNIMVRIYSENWDYDSRDGFFLKMRCWNRRLSGSCAAYEIGAPPVRS